MDKIVKEFKQKYNLDKVSNFVVKTYLLVSKEEHAPFISWSESGDSFIIWNQTEFAKILPEYFKTSNLTSFVRQLNTYDFHKVEKAKNMEFRHDKFRRGKVELLPLIKPKRPKKKADEPPDDDLGALTDIVKKEDIANMGDLKSVNIMLMKQMVSMKERQDEILQELAQSRNAQKQLEEEVKLLRQQVGGEDVTKEQIRFQPGSNYYRHEQDLSEITSSLEGVTFDIDNLSTILEQLSPNSEFNLNGSSLRNATTYTQPTPPFSPSNLYDGQPQFILTPPPSPFHVSGLNTSLVSNPPSTPPHSPPQTPVSLLQTTPPPSPFNTIPSSPSYQ